MSSKSVTEDQSNQGFGKASPHVLIVEDIAANAIVAKAILTRCGAIVERVAENGLIALELLRGHRYDLVFMDCMMPEMDGLDATRAIREGKAGEMNRNIPVIALTANARPEDRSACMASGMSDFVSKPVDAEVLLKALLAWFGKKHPGCRN